MIDRYSKALLTIIAVALCAIAAENAARPAQAQALRLCGEKYNPCYFRADEALTVETAYRRPLEVKTGDFDALTVKLKP